MTIILVCQLMLCNVEPIGDGEWHYRTNVQPKEGKCWYVGPRMKPRNELYWAETPAPPMKVEDKWQMRERFRTE